MAAIVLWSQDSLAQPAGQGAAVTVSEMQHIDYIQLDTCILTVGKPVDNLMGKLWIRVDKGRKKPGRRMTGAAVAMENRTAGSNARARRSDVNSVGSDSTRFCPRPQPGDFFGHDP